MRRPLLPSLRYETIADLSPVSHSPQMGSIWHLHQRWMNAWCYGAWVVGRRCAIYRGTAAIGCPCYLRRASRNAYLRRDWRQMWKREKWKWTGSEGSSAFSSDQAWHSHMMV